MSRACRAEPDQRVFSLNCTCSWVTPPKNIAPMSPLPTGNADVIHSAAGSSYHSLRGRPPLTRDGPANHAAMNNSRM